MPCMCSHDSRNLSAVTSGVVYCLRCKQHIEVRKRTLGVAKDYAPSARLLYQRHRPPPEELPKFPVRTRTDGECRC